MSNLTVAEQRVRKLARLPSNSICPNCGKFQKFGFTTVCAKFGTFICNECKSSHQAVSHRCKSLTMSSWDDREVDALERTGNERARNTWLATAPPCGTGGRPQPGDDIAVYKAFVVNAYERRMYYSAEGGCSPSSPSSPQHQQKQDGIVSVPAQHPPSPGKAFAKPKASSAHLSARNQSVVKPTASLPAVADLLDFGPSVVPGGVGGGRGVAVEDPFSKNGGNAMAEDDNHDVDDDFGTFQTSSAAPAFDAFSTSVPAATTTTTSTMLDFDPFGGTANTTTNSIPPFDAFSSSTTAADPLKAASTTVSTSSPRDDFGVFSDSSSIPSTHNASNVTTAGSFDFLGSPISAPTAPGLASSPSCAVPMKKPVMASNPVSAISGMDVMMATQPFSSLSQEQPSRMLHPPPPGNGGMASMMMPPSMPLPQMMNQMSMNPAGYTYGPSAMIGMGQKHGTPANSMNGMNSISGMNPMNGVAIKNGMHTKAMMNGGSMGYSGVVMTSNGGAWPGMMGSASAMQPSAAAGAGGFSPWAASQTGQANNQTKGGSTGSLDKFADLCKF